MCHGHLNPVISPLNKDLWNIGVEPTPIAFSRAGRNPVSKLGKLDELLIEGRDCGLHPAMTSKPDIRSKDAKYLTRLQSLEYGPQELNLTLTKPVLEQQSLDPDQVAFEPPLPRLHDQD